MKQGGLFCNYWKFKDCFVLQENTGIICKYKIYVIGIYGCGYPSLDTTTVQIDFFNSPLFSLFFYSGLSTKPYIFFFQTISYNSDCKRKNGMYLSIFKFLGQPQGFEIPRISVLVGLSLLESFQFLGDVSLICQESLKPHESSLT